MVNRETPTVERTAFLGTSHCAVRRCAAFSRQSVAIMTSADTNQ